MKTGDTVVITDGSYTRSVIDGSLVREFLNYGAVQGAHYTVIETDCSFPLDTEYPGQPEKYRNDTVIQDKHGKVVFIHHRFLRPATHNITIDGKTIEISNESYQALKKSLE